MTRQPKENQEKKGLAALLDGDEKVSRRKVLVAGAAAALGAATTAMLPAESQAAQGDVVKLGEYHWGATDTTTLSGSANNILFFANNLTNGQNAIGVRGDGFTGVVGWSTAGPISGKKPAGVHGHYSYMKGMDGKIVGTPNGIGVFGDISVTEYSGSRKPGNQGIGVWGRSGRALQSGANLKGTGVLGEGSKRGVCAVSDKRALEVRGHAFFSNAGSGFISAGARSKKVTGVSLNKNSLILVTLQNSAGPGVVVQFTKRISKSAFKVFLNKQATKKAKLAYFIVN